MNSLSNILFIPPCGYFKDLQRLISRSGSLHRCILINRINPYFYYPHNTESDLYPHNVTSVHTKFYSL